MKIVISAESTIDMPQDLLDSYGIKTTPFGILFNNELVADRDGISKEIYEYVEKTKVLPKTSAISPEQFKEHFANLKKDYDAIIHITLSAQLSSANANAHLAVGEEKDIYIIDSKTLSSGIGLLAIYATQLLKKGKSAQEIVAELDNKTNLVQASFVVEKLNYLHKGGRCSALTLLGANILKIKPQIVLSGGKMTVGKKYMGNMLKVVEKYCEDILAEYTNPDLSIAFITHSSPMPEAQKLLKAQLKKRGFKTVYDTLAGGTVSSHCGPNTIGVLFLNKE